MKRTGADLLFCEARAKARPHQRSEVNVALFNDDHPRTHHYHFAHRELVGASRRFAANIPNLARSGRLDRALVQTWDKAGELLPPEERLPAEGLSGSLHTAADLEIVVVTMPEVKHAAEVYFAAIVISGDELAAYYVLEHGWTTRDEPRTVLCAWDERGHINMGDGPPPEPEAFLTAVEDKIHTQGG
jgi:hypothetical protein